MSTTPTIYIEGLAFWTPTLPGWEAARAASQPGRVGVQKARPSM